MLETPPYPTLYGVAHKHHAPPLPHCCVDEYSIGQPGSTCADDGFLLIATKEECLEADAILGGHGSCLVCVALCVLSVLF
jgi:hypothetical protein